MATLSTREVIGWVMALLGALFGVAAVGLKTHFAPVETLLSLSGALTGLATAWGVAHYTTSPPSK